MGAAPAQEGGAGRGGDWAAERNPPPGRGGWGKGAGGIFAGAFPPDDDRGAAISPPCGRGAHLGPAGSGAGRQPGRFPGQGRPTQRRGGWGGKGPVVADAAAPFIDAGFCILLFWQEVGIL